MARSVPTVENSSCWWALSAADYLHYHDQEWGRPVAEDRRLFEKICLEGFQAGLSWLTILRKRENFRSAFAQFDYHKVANFGDVEVASLLTDSGIVRHRKKIESTINNAGRAIELVAEFGSLQAFFWQFVPPASERPKRYTREQLSQLTATPLPHGYPKPSRHAAGASLARPPPTLSCRRWVWLMITWKVVRRGSQSNNSGWPFWTTTNLDN